MLKWLKLTKTNETAIETKCEAHKIHFVKRYTGCVPQDQRSDLLMNYNPAAVILASLSYSLPSKYLTHVGLCNFLSLSLIRITGSLRAGVSSVHP